MKTATPNFQQSPDKTFTFTLTVPVSQITTEYQVVLKEVQASYETKGFRKGKAPLDVVQASISEDKIIPEVFSHLVSHLYQDLVTKHQLKPIVEPQVKIINPPLLLTKDWQVEITSCELPQIKLAPDYKSAIKKANSSKLADAQKLDLLFDTLLKQVTADIPQLLVEADVQKHLSDLVSQTQQAGITVAQYLKNQQTTLDAYRQKLEQKVKNEWLINLAISQIALDEKITPSQADVDQLVSKNEQLKTNPNLAYYLLTQQKVVDFLKSIA